MKRYLLALTLIMYAFVSEQVLAEKSIKFVPHADLKVLDPFLTRAYITRNHGYMIYDTLFSMDKNYKPQPQMVDTYETSKDGLTWTFTLRDGLKWHDGTPVKAEDCVASLKRWGVADGFGQLLFLEVKSIEVVNDKTFKINMKKPFPTMLEALGKVSSNVPFMLPKRVAETDPKKAIEDYTGSGPFIFKKEEWIPGSKVVYVKNKDYVPRKEPASFAAGGKVVHLDRIEWLYLPDAATTMAALQKGEIDYWEAPALDLLPILEKDSNLNISIRGRFGGVLRFNSLIPPFDNPKVRQAVMLALDQKEYLAGVTPSPAYREECYSVFTCGTPYANDAMTDIQKNGNLEKAKAALKDSGYDGRPVTILHTNDIPIFQAYGLITSERLKAIGMNVDLQTMDWGTLISRVGIRLPVDKGGWNIFHTAWVSVDLLNPTLIAYSGDPMQGWVGWYFDTELEKARKMWIDASDEKQRIEAARKVQERILGEAAWAPLGIIVSPFVMRKRLINAIDAPLPFLWNIDIAE